MNLSQQVVSLDLAKRMKELGAPQESLFWWVLNTRTKEFELRQKEELMGFIEDGDTAWPYLEEAKSLGHAFSAYTVAELGEMLPNYFKHEQKGYINLVIMKLDDGCWEVMYKEGGEVAFVERADTEPDARAKMWVYLKENNLI